MEYPLFNVPYMGGGMFIGIVAIIHVVIAHLSVGAGIFIALTHGRAVRRGDALLLDFLHRYGRFLVLLSFVAGALTGVGIWLSISLVSPSSTSALIHLFVWGWAIEWIFFLVEISTGYMYYYGWDRLTPRRHVAVAWIYAVSAFLSLFVINGIISFMLSPGDWQPPAETVGYDAQMAFFKGVFNPTFWPSVILRTISSLALAAVSVMIVSNCIRGYNRDQKQHIINISSYYLLPLGLMVPLAVWYFLRVPPPSRHFAFGGAIAMTLFFVFGVISSLYITLYAYSLVRNRNFVSLQSSLLLLGVAVLATGSMEFVREGIRKPYLIRGYLYSNGIPASPAWKERIDQDGILRYARFAYPPGMTLQEAYEQPLNVLGEYVFNAECRMCHQPGGINDPAPLINRSSRELVTQITNELHHFKNFMPPFMGTELEKQAVVEYQLQLAQSHVLTVGERDEP